MDTLTEEWFPTILRIERSEPVVDWQHLGSTDFHHPFYDHTIESLSRKPFGRFFRITTPLSQLAGMKQRKPSGFIFHISRCGSTLVSKALNRYPECTTFSEPSIFESLISLSHSFPLSTVSDWLRDLVGVFSARNTSVVFKLNPVQSVHLEFWRKAFPDTPWVFLYREPLEVLVANLRNPGFHQTLVPGVQDEEARLTEILRLYLESGIRHLDQQALTLRYRELSTVTVGEVASHFGIQAGPNTGNLVEALMGHDAKRPGIKFQNDSSQKRAEASPKARGLCERVLEPLVAQLDAVEPPGLA